MEKGNKTCVVDDQKSSSSSKNLEVICGDEIAENKSAEEIPSSDDSSDAQSQSQSQIQNIDGSINDLPPEILLQILGKLDAPSLFACRLVKRQFNSISTEILCCRREVQLQFQTERKKLMLVKNGKNSKQEKSLLDFVECMKQSENCPFARFSFDFYKSSISKLDYFLSQFDLTKVKCFKSHFGIWWDESSGSVFNLAERVRDLLLNEIPHLAEFGLEMSWAPGSKELNLFSSSSSIQLPHLKVLHFGITMFLKYRGIVGDLLNAAVNLEKIQPFYGDLLNLSVSDFCYLHSLGKLDCLQEIELYLLPNFMSEMKQNLPNLANLMKLSQLKLFGSLDLQKAPHLWSDAAVFLSALFHSIKNTVKSLEIWHLGFLPNVQWPRFTKLQKLTLYQNSFSNEVPRYVLFPPGVHFVDIFPAVRDLELEIKNWRVAFCEESFIPRRPNFESIQLNYQKEVACQIEQVALIFPNVKHLKIIPDIQFHLHFLQVGRAVATHLPKLETLELPIQWGSQENYSHALDSFFTGFSEENCKRLFDSVFEEAVKKPVRDSDFDVKSPESESEFESELIPEREHASIFHMKNLKKLTVNPYSYVYSAKNKGFTDKLTWISKKYTLELMPQLKITETED